MCLIATAMGDDKAVLHHLTEAAQSRGFAASHISLFPMPTVEDVAAHLLEQDVVWGVWRKCRRLAGDVAAAWRRRRLARGMAGRCVVMTGISAGSICWHVGGTTDSFGPQLQPVTNGLGFVPYANGVHYDSEAERRPLLHSLVSGGVLPAAYATDDGAGLLYRGIEFVEAVAEKGSAGAYFIEAHDGAAVETPLDVRRL